jgi:glutamyl-tRNA synthetase
MGDDGAKLSKRHGAVSVMEYRDQGYMPEALLNYLARLGWSNGDQEMFLPGGDDPLFDLDAMNKSASCLQYRQAGGSTSSTLPAEEVAGHLEWHMLYYASGFRLPASGFRLPASGFRLPASGFRLPSLKK